MRSEHQSDRKRRNKALAILALVWVLFGVYLMTARKQELELPSASTEVEDAIILHLKCENLNAFNRQYAFSDAVAGRRNVGK